MQRNQAPKKKRARGKFIDNTLKGIKKQNSTSEVLDVLASHQAEVAVSSDLLTMADLPPPAVKPPQKVKQYHTKNSNDMLQLQSAIRTDPANRNVKLVIKDAYPNETPNFIVAGTGLLENEFGVYAAADIVVRPGERQKFIGVYEGEYRAKMKEAEGKGRRYIFNHGYHGAVIDAEKIRNWTAFINHSELCNVTGLYYEQDGKHEIHLYALRSIAAGEPLYFNYGREYFDVYGFNPMYFGPKDNWKTLEDLWCENATHYDNNTFYLADSLRKNLGLKHDGPYVVPQLFAAVINGDYAQVQRCLEMNDNANDIIPFAINAKSGAIAPVAEQEKITPFMLACHLGDAKMINIFFTHFEDKMRSKRDFSLFADRCWKSGKTALGFLLTGLASNEDKKLFLQCFLQLKNFMEKTCYVNAYFALVDSERQSILAYCIQQQLPECVYLLVTDRGISSKLYEQMLAEPLHANLVTCLRNNSIATLEIILANAPQSLLSQITNDVRKNKLDFTGVTSNQLSNALPVLSRYLDHAVVSKIKDMVSANQADIELANSSHSFWSLGGFTEIVSGLFRTYGI